MIKKNSIISLLLLFISIIKIIGQKPNYYIFKGDSCYEIYDYYKAKEYYLKGISENETTENYFKLAKTLNPLKRKEYLESKKILNKLLSSKIEDTLLLAKINLELGELLRMNYQYDSSLICFKKSLELSKNLKYYEPLQKISRVYISLGDFNEALKFALMTEKSAMITNDNDLLARAYVDLGSIFLSLDIGSPKGLSYLNLALQTNGKTNTTTIKVYEALSIHTSNIAIEKDDKVLNSKAIEYMQKAYQYNLMIRDSIGMADNNLSLAQYYTGLGELDKARQKFKEAAAILLPSDSPQNIGRYYVYYGDFLRVTEIDVKKGLLYMSKAAEIWEKSGSKYNRSRVLAKIGEEYADMGNFKLAYKYQKEFQALDTEITGEKTRKQLQELNIKYETEKKDAQLAQQNIEIAQKNLQQKMNLINFLVAILVLAILIALLFYRNIKVKNKALTAQKIADEQTLKAKEAETFSHTISHDLRLPILNVRNTLELLLNQSNLDKETTDKIQKAHFTLQQTDSMVRRLLALFILEDEVPLITKVNTNELIEEVFEDVKLLGNENTKIKIDNLPILTTDRSLLKQIFTNLLSNAVKFSNKEESPLITVTSKSESNSHTIIIKDNGIGISSGFNKLFMPLMRYSNTGNFESVGLGLVIVKRITEKLKGTVSVIPQDKGFCIELSFPA